MSCVVYLISFEDQTAYVGSTKDLQRRMICHKTKCYNNNSDRPLYCKMRELAFGVSVLEETTPEDRYICENKWIEDLKPDLNVISAYTGLSKQDYHKKYNEEHKEEKKQYQNTKITCECGAMVSRRNIAQHKKTMKHLNKEYFQAKKLEKITCECGAIVSRRNIVRHKKTLKHLNNI